MPEEKEDIVAVKKPSEISKEEKRIIERHEELDNHIKGLENLIKRQPWN